MTIMLAAMPSIAESIQASPHYLGAIGFAGLQVIFVTLTGQGVSHLSSIGLSRSEIAITLLSGPICGAFFQPCFGRWSDQVQTRWGRRKPFIFVGAVVLILALLSLAWVESVTRITVSSTTPIEQHRLCLMVITFLLTFTIWIAVQAVQVGLRTLITDGCSQDEQARANAWASRYSNLAAAIANFLAYMDFLPHAASHSRTTFKDMTLLASVILAATVAISCASVKEKQPEEETFMPTDRRGVALRDIWRVFFATPNQIRTVCLVQFFAWMGWFPFLYYTVTYVNKLCTSFDSPVATNTHERTDKVESLNTETIKPTPDDTEPRRGLLALLVYSTVALVASIVLPPLVTASRLFDMRRLWITSQAVFGISMLATFLTSSSLNTIVLFGISGISWAVSAWIPYALLGAETSASPSSQDYYELAATTDHQGEEGKRYDSDENDEGYLSNDVGLVYGIHNLSICLPQILVTLGMGFERIMSDQKGESDAETDTSLAWVFRLAGVFSLVAMYIARGVREPK